MKIITNYFETLFKSIASFPFYGKIVKKPFSSSLLFFFATITWVTVVAIIGVTVFISPKVNKIINRFETRAANLFPPNLVITIKDGKLSTNVPEPFHIPIPYELFLENPPAVTDQDQQYFITIDTQADVDDALSGKSLIFVTQKFMVVSGSDNKTYPLSDIGDQVITKQKFDEAFSKALPYLKKIPLYLGVFGIFFILLILPIWLFTWILLMALVDMLAARMMGFTLEFGKAYQIGLHIIFVPIILKIILTILGVSVPVPYFYSLLYFFFSLVALSEIKKVYPK